MGGRFIVFEGIDGSGKSIQAGLLAKAFRRRHPVLCTREPGGTRIGERIRRLLLDPLHREMIPLTELFLYMASRAQILAEVIRPALQNGKTVICDRYYYSTAAYQGAAGGLGIDRILKLAEKFSRFEKPDIVFILDLNPRDASRRIRRTRDRMEDKGLAYHHRVRSAFRRMARRDSRRFRLIEASQSPEAVHAFIVRELADVL